MVIEEEIKFIKDCLVSLNSRADSLDQKFTDLYDKHGKITAEDIKGRWALLFLLLTNLLGIITNVYQNVQQSANPIIR